MAISLPEALRIYEQERRRLKFGEHPKLGCNCAFCDAIRAGDLLFNAGQALQTAIDLHLKRRANRQEAS